MEDRPSHNNLRWIRFTGDSVDRWSGIIDEIQLNQIPLNLIESIRLTTHKGETIDIKVGEIAGSDDENVGELIDQTITSKKNDLKAVEFAVNFDKLEGHILNAIIKLFDTSET